jgi:hypothetical protein
MFNFSADSGHKSETLKINLLRLILDTSTAVIPRNNGGDSHIIQSAFGS